MPEYRTPGVYIEEISAGPRPVAASSTTETGFVGILTLPTSFVSGRGKASGMYLPTLEDQAALTWNRALAFRGLLPFSEAAPAAPAGDGAAPADGTAPAEGGGRRRGGASPATAPATRAASSNRFQQIVRETLPGSWDVDAPGGEDVVSLRNPDGTLLRIPVRRTLMSVKTTDAGTREWDLAWGADEMQVVQLIASKAVDQGVKHTGNLGVVDPAGKTVTINLEAIQERLQGSAPAMHSLDGFEVWRRDFGKQLYVEIQVESDPNTNQAKAEISWEALSQESRNAWDRWLRSHPGMRRLELAVKGFFENGGKTAFVAMGVQAHGAAGPNKRKLLQDSFDGVSAVAMLAAPGLEFAWQQAILEYAGPRGRGDLFAILEAPRYLLTKNPRHAPVDSFRWTTGNSPYEIAELETIASPQTAELRFAGYSADEVLDRCIPRDDTGFGAAYAPWLVVDNPLSTGPHDRFVIAPPSGHVAGVIAATDLKPGGGVSKAPANEQLMGAAEIVTAISDKEQEALNVKGVNIIRQRPKAGIRIWGARTVAADPLWTYINVRRLFLFVERSVRDAIQWAVFLPNTQTTRGDLRSTIASFLYRLYMQGMLDGASWQEAFSVRCDSDNNPDVDVRSGLLTVDVEIRPVYPAEFIRVRFRQSPMRSEVAEG